MMDIENFIARCETGCHWGNDAQILFEALKSAGKMKFDGEDLLQFIKYHLSNGATNYYTKKREQHEGY
jgi:hypothetical protein